MDTTKTTFSKKQINAIKADINKALEIIEREMKISHDLRDYGVIATNSTYINNMNKLLKCGYVTY